MILSVFVNKGEVNNRVCSQTLVHVWAGDGVIEAERLGCERAGGSGVNHQSKKSQYRRDRACGWKVQENEPGKLATYDQNREYERDLHYSPARLALRIPI